MKESKMKEDFNFGEKIGAMQSDIQHIKEAVDKITTTLESQSQINKADMARHCEESDKKYLTKLEFSPYKKGALFVIALLTTLVITYAFNFWASYQEKLEIRLAKINSLDK